MTPLERLINYTFSNRELLEQALTHKSHSSAHNERLEFLGDSVLGAVIAEYLYLNFSDAKEGHLTRMKSQLVRGATLCKIAKELSLPEYLKLGAGERKSHGNYNLAILENSFEALIGAVFLDVGFSTTQEIILNIYATRLQSIDTTLTLKDNKTNLQELLQKRGLSLPQYTLVETKGKDHNAIFTVHARIPGMHYESTEEGKTIKFAEQNCAGTLLKLLQELM